MDQQGAEDPSSKEKVLRDVVENLKKQNKSRKEKLVAFFQKQKESSERKKGRNAALWEHNLSLWKKSLELFETIRKMLKEEPDLWEEELGGWKEEMALWKKELDRWEERFSGHC